MKEAYSSAQIMADFSSIVVVHGIVLATATDKATTLVVRKAAAAALNALQDDRDFITRACDCRATRGQSRAQLGYEEVDGQRSGIMRDST